MSDSRRRGHALGTALCLRRGRSRIGDVASKLGLCPVMWADIEAGGGVDDPALRRVLAEFLGWTATQVRDAAKRPPVLGISAIASPGVPQNALGVVLKVARGRQTYAEAAMVIGVSAAALMRMETGGSHPCLATAEKLASWLGWTPEQVLAECDVPVLSRS